MKRTIFANVGIVLLTLVVHAQDKALFYYGQASDLKGTVSLREPVARSILESTLVGQATAAAGLPCAKTGDVTSALLETISKRKSHAGGGCIRTPLVVDGVLKLGAGVYQVVKPITLKSESSIIGAGWETIIAESSLTGELNVVVASGAYAGGYGTNSNITLKNFKIIGVNPAFHSAPQTVQLGNCVNCTVDGLWLDRTHTIGIQLGGSAYNGNYAKDSKVINNLLTHTASQGIAVVNGENIEISNNQLLRPGQLGGPGNSSIDLEVNTPLDRLINIRIINNTIDHRDSEMATTGNGIIANSGDTERVSGILIHSNTIIGGNVDPVIPHLSNGIMVFGRHMSGTRVTRNKISRTGQTGIWLSGKNLVCEDNAMESVGGGGVAGFRVDDVRNSIIRRNPVKCTRGPCDDRMEIIGSSVGNIIAENSGWIMTPVPK